MKDREFRWNDYNRGKIAKHGVTQTEAEHVVRFAKRPYPKMHKKGTWIVQGRGNSNRMLQVVFTIDQYEDWFIIHAMPVR